MDVQIAEGCTGFDVRFLDTEVSLPALAPELEHGLVQLDGLPHIPYSQFTVSLVGYRGPVLRLKDK